MTKMSVISLGDVDTHNWKTSDSLVAKNIGFKITVRSVRTVNTIYYVRKCSFRFDDMDDGYYDSFESSGESGQEENEFEMKETAPAISLPPSNTGGKEDDLIRNVDFLCTFIMLSDHLILREPCRWRRFQRARPELPSNGFSAIRSVSTIFLSHAQVFQV